MSIDLSGIVTSMADTSLTVTRHVAGWGTDGRPTDSTSAFAVVALVLPRRGRALMDLQGDVAGGAVDVYSSTRLVVGDTFTYYGAAYRVETVAGYEATGNFCVAVARKVP